MDSETVRPADLGVEDDPGTSWHPRHVDAYDVDGNLDDLDDEEVAEHMTKPEAQTEMAHRERASLAAEDSAETPEEEV